jgi:hypothetical protein
MRTGFLSRAAYFFSGVLLAGVLLAGCGAPEAESPGAAPVSASVPHLVADAAPEVIVESGLGGFGLVASALWLGDGTIAVADAHNRHVRLFDAAGIERDTAGRRGEGPGEFESVDRLWTVGPDSAAVWDTRLMRYTVIAGDGGIGRTVRLEPTGERARPTPLGFASNGSLIAVNDPRGMPEDERYRADLALLVYDGDGVVSAELATFPGDEMWNWVWEMGVTPSIVPFGRPTVVDLRGNAVFVGTNDGYRVDRYDVSGFAAGSPVVQARTVVQLDRQPRPVAQGLIDDYLAAERAKASSGAAAKGGNDIFGLMAADAPYPETLPFYDLLLTDGAGRLWVRDYVTDYDAATVYTVFGPDGIPVATAELPARFRPTAIDGNRVLGVWRDPLDVEQVRVYVVR